MGMTKRSRFVDYVDQKSLAKAANIPILTELEQAVIVSLVNKPVNPVFTGSEREMLWHTNKDILDKKLFKSPPSALKSRLESLQESKLVERKSRGEDNLGRKSDRSLWRLRFGWKIFRVVNWYLWDYEFRAGDLIAATEGRLKKRLNIKERIKAIEEGLKLILHGRVPSGNIIWDSVAIRKIKNGGLFSDYFSCLSKKDQLMVLYKQQEKEVIEYKLEFSKLEEKSSLTKKEKSRLIFFKELVDSKSQFLKTIQSMIKKEDANARL